MYVGLRRINLSNTHSKIGDRLIEIEQMDICGWRNSTKTQYDIEKYNPIFVYMESELNKKQVLINKEDMNTYGYHRPK